MCRRAQCAEAPALAADDVAFSSVQVNASDSHGHIAVPSTSDATVQVVTPFPPKGDASVQGGRVTGNRGTRFPLNPGTRAKFWSRIPRFVSLRKFVGRDNFWL